MFQSAIARELGVSSSCISRIWKKYRETGSVLPGGGIRSHHSAINGSIVKYLRALKEKDSHMTYQEIQNKLLADGICSYHNLPSVSTIARKCRKKLKNLQDLDLRSIKQENRSYPTLTAATDLDLGIWNSNPCYYRAMEPSAVQIEPSALSTYASRPTYMYITHHEKSPSYTCANYCQFFRPWL